MRLVGEEIEEMPPEIIPIPPSPPRVTSAEEISVTRETPPVRPFVPLGTFSYNSYTVVSINAGSAIPELPPKLSTTKPKKKMQADKGQLKKARLAVDSALPTPSPEHPKDEILPAPLLADDVIAQAASPQTGNAGAMFGLGLFGLSADQEMQLGVPVEPQPGSATKITAASTPSASQAARKSSRAAALVALDKAKQSAMPTPDFDFGPDVEPEPEQEEELEPEASSRAKPKPKSKKPKAAPKGTVQAAAQETPSTIFSAGASDTDASGQMKKLRRGEHEGMRVLSTV